jgi:hypothetical protein
MLEAENKLFESGSLWGTVISGHKTAQPATGLRERERQKRQKRSASETEILYEATYIKLV